MLITLEFMQNNSLIEEEKELQDRAYEAIYADFLDFVKSEKDFWIEEIKDGLRSQYGKLKNKQLNFLATKTWMGINSKNVRKAFPLEMIWDGYEKIEYNEETGEFIIERKSDEDEEIEKEENVSDVE